MEKGGKDVWYLLCLLDCAKEVRGVIRFQKLVYICSKRNVPFNYEFTEFYYGPYSPPLASNIERFRELKLINVKKEPSSRLTATGKRPKISIFSLTNKGKEEFNLNIDSIKDVAPLIKEIVNECIELSLEELIDLSLREAGIDGVPNSVLEYFSRKPLKIYEELDSVELVHKLLEEKARK